MEYLKSRVTIEPPKEKRISFGHKDSIHIASLIPITVITNAQPFGLRRAA
jgi:hypothetical protein